MRRVPWLRVLESELEEKALELKQLSQAVDARDEELEASRAECDNLGEFFGGICL